jgi:hypothetical protein
MNRIAQFVVTVFTPRERTSPAATARNLYERSSNARGQSRYEAAQLRANAQAMLSILR